MPTDRRRLTALRLPFSAPRSPSPEHGSPISSEAEDQTASYLADLLADTREELTRADTKAALILAATGVVIGALLAGLFGGKWTPFYLNNRIQWLWWLGVASAAFGVFSIAAAVYPLIRRRGAAHPGVPAYYGDVIEYETIDAFRHAIEKAPKPRERLIDQTFVVSRIVQRKYVLLRRGLRCLLLAIVACIAAVMISILLSR
jgi:MFS family permease